MYVTTRRASAWLDTESIAHSIDGVTAESIAARRSRCAAQVLFATRPLQTPLGRCIALKMVSATERGTESARFFVLLVGRHESSPLPRWMPIERVLGEAYVHRWLKSGFAR